MTLAIELSGEHPDLARAEARAVTETLGGRVVEAWHRVLIVDSVEDPGALADRLALAWRVLKVEAIVEEPSPEAIAEAGSGLELDPGRTFAVRGSRLIDGLDANLLPAVERQLGTELSGQANVDLETPGQVVRVLLEEQAVIGLEVARVDRQSYEARHPEERPFFSPVSTHPRMARLQLNMARVPAGATVWDPFCGTGGLVLEAALAGCQAIGSDLDPAMIDGTDRNLAAFGAEAELLHGDVADVADQVQDRGVQAIVTDPPYGRASSTHKEGIRSLYQRFLTAASQVLAPGGRLVVVLPDPGLLDLDDHPLEVEERLSWKVHGSLTRHLVVARRREHG